MHFSDTNTKNPSRSHNFGDNREGFHAVYWFVPSGTVQPKLFSVSNLFAAAAVFFFVAAAADGLVVFYVVIKLVTFVAAVTAIASECHLEVLLKEGVNKTWREKEC